MPKENPWAILEQTEPARLYARHTIVYLQEQTAVQFYYLVSGSVEIFLTAEDGAQHTLRLGHRRGQRRFRLCEDLRHRSAFRSAGSE